MIMSGFCNPEKDHFMQGKDSAMKEELKNE